MKTEEEEGVVVVAAEVAEVRRLDIEVAMGLLLGRFLLLESRNDYLGIGLVEDMGRWQRVVVVVVGLDKKVGQVV